MDVHTSTGPSYNRSCFWFCFTFSSLVAKHVHEEDLKLLLFNVRRLQYPVAALQFWYCKTAQALEWWSYPVGYRSQS